MSGELFHHLIKHSVQNKITGSVDIAKARKVLHQIFPEWKKEPLTIDNRSAYWNTHNYFQKYLDKYKIFDSFEGPYDEDVEWFIEYLIEHVGNQTESSSKPKSTKSMAQQWRDATQGE